MIVVDTNILVYVHREDSPWHDSANASIVDLFHQDFETLVHDLVDIFGVELS